MEIEVHPNTSFAIMAYGIYGYSIITHSGNKKQRIKKASSYPKRSGGRGDGKRPGWKRRERMHLIEYPLISSVAAPILSSPGTLPHPSPTHRHHQNKLKMKQDK
jgi:hypothetical protein